MNNIKKVLADKGISQVWLAAKLGLTVQTVNRLVNQEEPLSFLHAHAFADVLNVDIKELYV